MKYEAPKPVFIHREWQFSFEIKNCYKLSPRFDKFFRGMGAVTSSAIWQIPPPRRGMVAGTRHFFSHRSSGPPVHFTHQTLTISSFGYLLWRNKRHCYPFYYSKRKVSKRIWWTYDLNSHPENKQCYYIHVALPTALYEQLTAARLL